MLRVKYQMSGTNDQSYAIRRENYPQLLKSGQIGSFPKNSWRD